MFPHTMRHPLAGLMVGNGESQAEQPRNVQVNRNQKFTGRPGEPELSCPRFLCVQVSTLQNGKGTRFIASVSQSPDPVHPWTGAGATEAEALYSCVADVIARPEGGPKNCPAC